MSIGIGGHARIVAEDADMVIYEYYAYDLNVQELRNEQEIYDGLLMIDKRALVEPAIHRRIKRWLSGRKEEIIKRIPNPVDIDALIDRGMVMVTKSKYGRSDAYRVLLNIIFMYYQLKGTLPESRGYIA